MMNGRSYSSYYVPGTQPVTSPGATTMAPYTMGAIGVPGTGYSSVNPMGTTMAPGTYTQGAAIASTPATWAPSTYTTTGYYSPVQTYPVRQRRGLFGGMFGRRNRQVYSTGVPAYSYGTAPGTYTYTPAPGTYTYAPSPY